jgi:hypothetical protein
VLVGLLRWELFKVKVMKHDKGSKIVLKTEDVIIVAIIGLILGLLLE